MLGEKNFRLCCHHCCENSYCGDAFLTKPVLNNEHPPPHSFAPPTSTGSKTTSTRPFSFSATFRTPSSYLCASQQVPSAKMSALEEKSQAADAPPADDTEVCTSHDTHSFRGCFLSSSNYVQEQSTKEMLPKNLSVVGRLYVLKCLVCTVVSSDYL